jgi:hypothetical protein
MTVGTEREIGLNESAVIDRRYNLKITPGLPSPYFPVTSVPIFSPITTARRLPSLNMSKTTIGT